MSSTSIVSFSDLTIDDDDDDEAIIERRRLERQALLQQLTNGKSNNGSSAAAPASKVSFEVVSAAVDVVEDDRDSDEDEAEDNGYNDGLDAASDESPGKNRLVYLSCVVLGLSLKYKYKSSFTSFAHSCWHLLAEVSKAFEGYLLNCRELKSFQLRNAVFCF